MFEHNRDAGSVLSYPKFKLIRRRLNTRDHWATLAGGHEADTEFDALLEFKSYSHHVGKHTQFRFQSLPVGMESYPRERVDRLFKTVGENRPGWKSLPPSLLAGKSSKIAPPKPPAIGWKACVYPTHLTGQNVTNPWPSV